MWCGRMRRIRTAAPDLTLHDITLLLNGTSGRPLKGCALGKRRTDRVRIPRGSETCRRCTVCIRSRIDIVLCLGLPSFFLFFLPFARRPTPLERILPNGRMIGRSADLDLDSRFQASSGRSGLRRESGSSTLARSKVWRLIVLIASGGV